MPLHHQTHSAYPFFDSILDLTTLSGLATSTALVSV
jgi:hypothetical protein